MAQGTTVPRASVACAVSRIRRAAPGLRAPQGTTVPRASAACVGSPTRRAAPGPRAPQGTTAPRASVACAGSRIRPAARGLRAPRATCARRASAARAAREVSSAARGPASPRRGALGATASDQSAPSRSHSPKRSPIISVGRWMFPVGTVGMRLASATMSPSMPSKRPRPSTAPSPGRPIGTVPHA